jgi:hypothetical protein
MDFDSLGGGGGGGKSESSSASSTSGNQFGGFGSDSALTPIAGIVIAAIVLFGFLGLVLIARK